MKGIIKPRHNSKRYAMTKFIAMTFGCVILYSCNTQPKIAAKPVSTLITHKEAMDTIPMQAMDSVILDSLDALPVNYTLLEKEDAKQLLGKLDVDGLISSFRGGDAVYNGFLGDNHYRVELYIKTVENDSNNPFLLKVSGKSRYKKNVTPFTGTIDIAQVYSFSDKTYEYKTYLRKKKKGRDRQFSGDSTTTSYHARGTFAFAEQKNAKGAGVFSGSLFMDFRKDDQSEFNDETNEKDAYSLMYGSGNNTRAAGLLMEGKWENYAHTSSKPLIAARDLFVFANNILEDFSYGSREVEVNKKYHALGWDNYWDGEEWWSDETPAEKTVMMLIY